MTIEYTVKEYRHHHHNHHQVSKIYIIYTNTESILRRYL